MNRAEFVRGVKERVGEVALRDVMQQLEDPSGKSPEPNLVLSSRWFHGLPQESRLTLQKVLQETIDATVFGLFCVLDGVRFLEDSENKGQFELYFVKDEEKIRLNGFGGELLHDLL